MSKRSKNVSDEVSKLRNDSRIVKRAHFIAAEREKNKHNIVGVTIIILNVLIASNLVDVIVSTEQSLVIIKLLAFVGAAFAGVQTFFNFQKKAETHLTAGNIYSKITRKADILFAESDGSTLSNDKVVSELKTLVEEYLQANTDYEASVPTNQDYDKARVDIRKKDTKE